MSSSKYAIPAAGSLTSQQSGVCEPSFIRKKKEQGHEDKRTDTTKHDMVYIKCNIVGFVSENCDD